jgi:hypothetical protein
MRIFICNSFDDAVRVSGYIPWNSRIINIQGVPGWKVNILGGHCIGHSKQNSVYVHMSYSERFPR